MRQEIIETRVPGRLAVDTSNHGHMILITSARRKGIRVILDSSIQRNFISPEIIG
jgi:hypothetical protein